MQTLAAISLFAFSATLAQTPASASAFEVASNVRGFPMMRGALPMSQLAEGMSHVVNRPVIDKTGLTERYSFFLSYAPLSPQTTGNIPEYGPPDFFTAVQKQLGLKLEPAKDNIEVVVVDHAEQLPTEN
jgi:uncharacterized protein (TIGR03435 family)